MALDGAIVQVGLEITRRWIVSKVEKDTSFELVFGMGEPIRPGRLVSAYEVRAEFLSIASDEEAIGFFEKYGPFHSQAETTYPLRRLRWEQRRIEEDMLLTWDEWFGSGEIKLLNEDGTPNKAGNQKLISFFAANLRRSPDLKAQLIAGGKLGLFSDNENVNDAITAATYMDKIMKTAYSRCTECSTVFVNEQKRSYRFCSTPCKNKATKREWKQKQMQDR